MKKDFDKVALFSEQAGHLHVLHVQLQEKFDRLKQKLEDSHQTLEKIVGHMSDGLMFVTFQGVVTLFNGQAELLTGFEQPEILGTSYWLHFSDTLFGFSMKKALLSPLSYHRVFLTLNETKEVEISTSYIPEKGILLLLRDRTEIEQLEKNLAQNDRLKELGEMAAVLAHEIRNPLGGIEGFARLLARDLQNPSHLDMLDSILEGTRALNRLVTNVLGYAKELELHFAPLNLAETIEDVISFASLDPKACQIFFEKKGENWVLADKESLKRVLLNLFRNAFEAKAKKIQIRLFEEGLKITDDGEGILETHLQKIFSPFFTTKSYGTGLGLAECYKIIQAHGGEISVESKGKGLGSTFTLKLRKFYAN